VKKNNLIKLLLVITLASIGLSCSTQYIHLNHDRSSPINLHIEEELFYPNSPLAEPIDKTRKEGSHYLGVLNKGDDALLSVIHLIRNAQRSILIQTFIWSTDESGKFITAELVKAAEREVKIKIIIDYLNIGKNPHLIAHLSSVHPNIEVKFYNPVAKNITASKAALLRKALLNFKGLNQRMHNKVLIVDDIVAILGGRNYQNDYFDRGLKRNFIDKDVVIVGSAVKQMTDSFGLYWQHPLSVESGKMRDKRSLLGKKVNLTDGPSTNDNIFRSLNACEVERECIEKRIITKMHRVNNVKFIADLPGKISRIGPYKVSESTAALYDFLETAQEAILMQTPYLVTGRKGTLFFKRLRRQKPNLKIKVSSNSLASADHTHAYAFSYKNKKKYIKNFHWQIYELRPNPADNDILVTPINKEQRAKNYFTCVHAKAFVVDKKKAWIGSFNIDPRSVNLNTEVALIIDDETVAREITQDIERAMANQNSWTIAKRKQLPVISHFSGLLSTIIELVPLIDIWPFTYSGSYELKEGKSAVPFLNESFYDNYTYVGPFPGVELSEREIKARLIKAFFGVAEPLI
jgi:cardiolipin synthase C